jgi:hypothetical protein
MYLVVPQPPGGMHEPDERLLDQHTGRRRQDPVLRLQVP